MVFRAYRQPLYVGIGRRPLRNRPAFQHAIDFEPQIPVQPGGIVLLDNEDVARRAVLSLTRWFGRALEIALRVILG